MSYLCLFWKDYCYLYIMVILRKQLYHRMRFCISEEKSSKYCPTCCSSVTLFRNMMQAMLCSSKGIPVIPIPGPCALVTALSASGLRTNEFTFGKVTINSVWPASNIDDNVSDMFEMLLWCLVFVLMQLVFSLNMLVLERRGWWFQQLKQQHKFFLFPLTNFLCFSGKFIVFLVLQGKCFGSAWTLFV